MTQDSVAQICEGLGPTESQATSLCFGPRERCTKHAHSTRAGRSSILIDLGL